jgi:tetraacyldisaccharide 4'-kinase
MPGWIADKVAGFRLVPKSLKSVSSGKSIDLRSTNGTPVMIFSGLGDPRSFRRSVEGCGCVVVRENEFPDHHWYSEIDLKRLEYEFRDSKAEFAVTTEKDLVRLRSLENWEQGLPDRGWLHVLEIEIEFVAGEEMIDGLIQNVTR